MRWRGALAGEPPVSSAPNTSRAAAALLALLICHRPLDAQENRITMGPGFEKGQRSEKELAFDVPKGWTSDPDAAREAGLYAVFVPAGKTLKTTDKAITVAFQKKDSSKPDMADLEGFFRADMAATLAAFPETEGTKWQPAGLDPDKFKFMSVELFGRAKNKPSPHRVLILDAGDGFYSIVLTTASRKDLDRPEFEKFFNSIRFRR